MRSDHLDCGDLDGRAHRDVKDLDEKLGKTWTRSHFHGGRPVIKEHGGTRVNLHFFPQFKYSNAIIRDMSYYGSVQNET